MLLFGRLYYGERNAVSNAIGCAMHRSPFTCYLDPRLQMRAGNVIETYQHKADFKEA
jgi:hypothetical protein